MKRYLAQQLARRYPAAWRERYGAEFDALLAESDLRWSDVLDIAAGALDAHSRAQQNNRDERALTMWRRRLTRWITTLLALTFGGLAIVLFVLSYGVVPPPNPENMTTVTGELLSVAGDDCPSCDLTLRLSGYEPVFYINRFGSAAQSIRATLGYGETVTLTVFARYIDDGSPLRGSIPTMMIAGEGGSFAPNWYNPDAIAYTDHRIQTRVVALILAVVALGFGLMRQRLLRDRRKSKLVLA